MNKNTRRVSQNKGIRFDLFGGILLMFIGALIIGINFLGWRSYDSLTRNHGRRDFGWPIAVYYQDIYFSDKNTRDQFIMFRNFEIVGESGWYSYAFLTLSIDIVVTLIAFWLAVRLIAGWYRMRTNVEESGV